LAGSHCRRATALAVKLRPLQAIQEAGAARSVFLWRLLYGRHLHTACDCCAFIIIMFILCYPGVTKHRTGRTVRTGPNTAISYTE